MKLSNKTKHLIEHQDEIVKSWVNGKSKAELTRRYNCSHGTIRKLIGDNKRPELYWPGERYRKPCPSLINEATRLHVKEKYGAKYISKKLNITIRKAKTILEKSGVYDPSCSLNYAKRKAKTEIEKIINAPLKGKRTKFSDLPLFKEGRRVKELKQQKARMKARGYDIQRYRSDPAYYLKCNLRKRLLKFVNRENKSKRTMELVECSPDQLKQHIQSQFNNGMNWNNRGKTGWHIDHIIPCSWFDLQKEEHQLICFNWRNLRPEWAKDNLRKSNRVEPTREALQECRPDVRQWLIDKLESINLNVMQVNDYHQLTGPL